MKTVSESWGAAETKRFAVPGRYFRLLSTTSPVDVEFYQGGRHLNEEKASGVEAGYFAIPPKGFSEFKLASALAQTIKFAVTGGSGGYDRNVGDVNVIGSAAVIGPRALTSGAILTDLPILTREVGAAPGANYANNTNMGVAGNSPVFLAAANTNGAIVWSAQAVSGAATANGVSLLAKATAPTTAIDGLLLYILSTAAGVTGTGARLERARFIPAGLGLYWFSGAAETASTRFTDYTLL